MDLDYFICKITYTILVHKASLTKFHRIGIIQAKISDDRAIEKFIRKLVTIPAYLEILNTLLNTHRSKNHNGCFKKLDINDNAKLYVKTNGMYQNQCFEGNG